MIFKNSSPISPTVNITIDNVPVDYMSLHGITIEMKENMHNLAVLEFGGLDPKTLDLFIQKPISIKIMLRDLTPCVFVGYIVFLEPFHQASLGTVNKSPFQLTRVYCFGASYKMKSLKSTVYENSTLPTIAKEIADRYKFSLSVPNDDYVFPRLVQASQSDWTFLVKTANRLGYNVMLEGTHLHIWDPFKSISRYKTHYLLTTLKGSKGDPTAQPGQILKFDGTMGIISSTTGKIPDTIHSLGKDGSIISVSNKDSMEVSGLGQPLESTFSNVLNINTDSYETAEKLVSGTLRLKFPFTANLDVVAYPSIAPGKIVRVLEFNSEFDGFWYVRGVRHEITQATMVTSLDIARDSLGSISSQSQIMQADFYKNPPTPALISKTWVSSQNMVNVYN